MFEAASTLLLFFSGQLSLHRVQANVDPGHKASIDCSNVLVFSPRAIFGNAGSLARRSMTRYSMELLQDAWRERLQDREWRIANSARKIKMALDSVQPLNRYKALPAVCKSSFRLCVGVRPMLTQQSRQGRRHANGPPCGPH